MVAKTHADKLDDIKENIEEAFDYFSRNYERYQEFMRFVFVSTLTDEDAAKLQLVGKPPITCNILEGFVMQQISEANDNEPSPIVRNAEGVLPMQETQEATRKLLQQHLKAVINAPNNDQLADKFKKDLYGGGFTAAKIWIDYASEMSCHKVIRYDRVFNPCFTFFDPMARASHKGDGEFVGECVPMTEHQFKCEFPNVDTSDIKFAASSNLKSFTWAYKNEKRKIIMVAYYYAKKSKKQKIVELSDGQVMTPEKYEEFLLNWSLQGRIEQAPEIVNSRVTTLTKICRYTLCQTKMLAYEETEFSIFPIIFGDGNSVEIQESWGGSYQQYTKPYALHAKGIQKLADFTMQTMGAEIENMVMTKFMAAIEAMPDDSDYLDAYRNPQSCNVMLYKSHMDGNPNAPLPAPTPIPRTQTPAVVLDTFHSTDAKTQMALGSFQMQEGLQADLSGKAMLQSQVMARKNAIAYEMGYLRMYERVCECIIDLIPKLYKTPRSIPIINDEGEHEYLVTDGVQAPFMDYDPKTLAVTVTAGPSVAAQRQMALQQLTELCKILPSFAQFLDQKGGTILFDNIDINGVENLKAMYKQWMDEQQGSQQQQQQIQQAMQQQEMQMRTTQIAETVANVILKRKEAEAKAEEINMQQQHFIADYIQKDQENDRNFKLGVMDAIARDKEANADMLKAQMQAQTQGTEQLIKVSQIEAENERTEVDKFAKQVDAVVKLADHLHTREMDLEGLKAAEHTEPDGDESN
jgi:hypothetical protein